MDLLRKAAFIFIFYTAKCEIGCSKIARYIQVSLHDK